jgi:hypothetical protein
MIAVNREINEISFSENKMVPVFKIKNSRQKSKEKIF